MDELHKLREIFEAGFINQSEFENRKAYLFSAHPELASENSDASAEQHASKSLYDFSPSSNLQSSSPLYEPNSALNSSGGLYNWEEQTSSSLYSPMVPNEDPSQPSSNLYNRMLPQDDATFQDDETLKMIKNSYEHAELDETIREEILRNLGTFLSTMKQLNIPQQALANRHQFPDNFQPSSSKPFTKAVDLVQVRKNLRQTETKINSFDNLPLREPGFSIAPSSDTPVLDDLFYFFFLDIETKDQVSILTIEEKRQQEQFEQVNELLSNPLISDREDLCMNYRSMGRIPPVLVEDPSWVTLVTLQMRGCNLYELSTDMKNLINLRYLDVSHNHLINLDPLAECFPLESINASYNCILHFPDSLGQLPNLKQLNLYDNSIELSVKSLGSVKIMFSCRKQLPYLMLPEFKRRTNHLKKPVYRGKNFNLHQYSILPFSAPGSNQSYSSGEVSNHCDHSFVVAKRIKEIQNQLLETVQNSPLSQKYQTINRNCLTHPWTYLFPQTILS